MKRLILLLSFSLVILSAQAQTDTLKKSGFKFQSVSAVYGGFYGGLFNVGLSDIENISGPNPAFSDSGSFSHNYYNEWNNVTVWGNFDVLKHSSEFYQTVGLGLSYYNSNALGFHWSNNYRETVDTLFSNTDHTYALVDSIYSHNKSGSLNARNLMVLANYKISSNPKRKFSFFASANLGIGGTVSSQYNFNEYSYSGKEAGELIDTLNQSGIHHQFGYFADHWHGTDKETTKTVPGYFVLKPYITGGVTYRLSKHINVLKHMALTLEVRVGSQHLFFKDRVFSGFSRGMAIGLNYTFM
jgi:hypothetical protein